MKWYKFRKIESGNVRIKVRSLLDWDGITPKIDEVIFTDDFHLIVTFKNGIVKDVDAYTFMDMEELSWYFEELRDDIDLFQNPYTVTPSYIRWNDRADISSEGLWEWGKTLVS